jgi:S1-C subfamily serine protease
LFSEYNPIFRLNSCSSAYNEDDTCSIFYATKENYDIRKIKNASLWKDPKRYRNASYYYTNIFISEYTHNSSQKFLSELGKKKYLDSTEDDSYSTRNLKLDIRLTRLASTQIRLFSPDFSYDFAVQFVVSSPFEENIYSYTAKRKTPLNKLNSFASPLSEDKTIRNIAKYIDSLLLTCMDEFLTKDVMAGIEKKTDSIAKARLNMPPIELKTANKATGPKIGSFINSVVTIKLEKGHGSGCIISDDGYIVTNYHVTGREKEVTIVFNDGSTKKAEVVRTHPEEDLALLKLPDGNYKPLYFKNEDEYTLGAEVYAVGTPADIDLGQTVSKGIISGQRKMKYGDYLQMDIKINPGNSGGALMYKTGELIGVINAKMVGRGIEGIGFAIPAKKVMSSLVLIYK